MELLLFLKPLSYQLMRSSKPPDITLQGTNISPQKWHFEDDVPIPFRWDMLRHYIQMLRKALAVADDPAALQWKGRAAQIAPGLHHLGEMRIGLKGRASL